ncbi:MAG TPA: histidine phosphatase family protein [Mycobacteriales bacterium]|jgi:broad specificity phosphatase PhoE|nr:histidine phosphatase family protein [Mycobacteriales bacterium]
MEIVLVRHALPLRVDVTAGGGAADPPLAPRGIEQAARVVQALAGDDVSAVYTSPLARARQTAAPLAQALGLEALVEPDIAEFDSADPSYVPVEELKAAGDPRWHALARGDLYSAGVDPAAFRARVVAAVEAVAQRHPGGRAVLFSHAGACNAYLGHVLGQSKAIWFAPAYCSLSRVGAARDGRRGVISLNETGHVRDLLAGRPG